MTAKAERQPGASADRWDIRTEPYTGVSFNKKTGVIKNVTGTRIRYRPKGTRGRFREFTVVGNLPSAPLADIVSKYEDELVPKYRKEMGR